MSHSIPYNNVDHTRAHVMTGIAGAAIGAAGQTLLVCVCVCGSDCQSFLRRRVLQLLCLFGAAGSLFFSTVKIPDLWRENLKREKKKIMRFILMHTLCMSARVGPF